MILLKGQTESLSPLMLRVPIGCAESRSLRSRVAGSGPVAKLCVLLGLIALCCPPEVDGKNSLLKTPHTLVIEQRESKLKHAGKDLLEDSFAW